MKYTEFDLQRIISDVENDFKKSLSKAENVTEETEIILTKSEGYSTEEIEELSSIYAGLSKAEVEAHYEALTKHWETDTQEVMTKSENEETSLVKSENALLKSENDNLKKSIEDLVAALKANVNKAPERKAITSVEYIAKSEQAPKTEVKQYSRPEAISKLRSVAQEKALSKSDQEAVMNFTLDNTLSTETIKHLL
jgi:hypothetical protein